MICLLFKSGILEAINAKDFVFLCTIIIPTFTFVYLPIKYTIPSNDPCDINDCILPMSLATPLIWLTARTELLLLLVSSGLVVGVFSLWPFVVFFVVGSEQRGPASVTPSDSKLPKLKLIILCYFISLQNLGSPIIYYIHISVLNMFFYLLSLHIYGKTE